MKTIKSLFLIFIASTLFIIPSLAEPLEVDIEGKETVDLHVFNPTSGFANHGVLSLISFIAQLAFAFLIVVWVFISIFAGIKMIKGAGKPEDIEGGMKRIKNMWLGASIGILFFIAVSFLGTMAGIGNIFLWAENLQECSCENAVDDQDCYVYLFQAKASDDTKIWQCDDNGLGWK